MISNMDYAATDGPLAYWGVAVGHKERDMKLTTIAAAAALVAAGAILPAATASA